ncbi:hypothetical protein RB195_016650 [Necator americanus]|uniref:Reverse transcriptase domain-containing protein n=1 Tax=Necator americanus TaxID=51031 RepID=A0ABR1C4R3_NECAM
MGKLLDEEQPCEQAVFRKELSMIARLHTILKSIEVSREYRIPLCLIFIDLKKAFDSVEKEAVTDTLDNQGLIHPHSIHKGTLSVAIIIEVKIGQQPYKLVNDTSFGVRNK